MAKVIDFYFDFASPYAYLASQRIESIAQSHDKTVNWHPVLLGAIFKVSGQKPLTESPLIGEYAVYDLQRCAREFKIPYNHPGKFPIATVAAARAVYWVNRVKPQQAAKLIHALFRAYFVDGIDISTPDNVLTTAAKLAINPDELGNALQQQDLKDELKKAVDKAIERGVFGSPCCIVDGESFWGNDRIDQLDKWLKVGGW